MTELAHILIVDDDPNIRRLFHDMLTNRGYRVSLVGSGEEALSYLHLITPDLILLDLTLPGIDGREVVRQLKADTTKPFIPVIMVTAQSDLETSVLSLDAGADDFMVKPVAIDQLLAHVRAMLRLQRAQRGLRTEQRKTELLLHLTRELGASIDLDVLLTRFLDHLADAVGAVRASIILINAADDGQPLCYSSSRNPATPILNDILRHGVAGWVLRERQQLVIDDTRDDPRWIGTATFHTNIRSVAASPVMREGRVLGVITLVHHTPGYFTGEHIELLSSVAAQSAVAVESAQLFGLTQRQKELLARRADDLRRINEINAHLSELMYPEQLVRLVVYMVQQQFGYPQVSLLMRDGDDLVVQVSAGCIGTVLPHNLRFPISQGVNGWAIRNRQIVRVDDVRADERFVALRSEDNLVRSELVVPIMLRREILGTLDVQSEAIAAFGPNDEALLNAIVGQFSIALGNAKLLENEQRRIRQLNQVNNLSVAITAHFDTTQNLRLAIDAITDIFGVKQSGLVLLGADGPSNDMLIVRPGPLQAFDDGMLHKLRSNPDLPRLIREIRAPTILWNWQQDSALALLYHVFYQQNISALLLIPLLVGTRNMGVLCIDLTDRVTNIDNAEVELAMTVGSLVVQVMENTRLYRVVEDERSTLNAVLRGAADAILLIGSEDELLLANRAAEERLQLNLIHDRGKPLYTLLNGHANPLFSNLLPLLTTPLHESNSYGPVELSVSQDTTYSISVAPVRSADGQPLGRVAVLQDITAIKVLERQERERVRSVFRRYVSPMVAESLLSAGQELGKPTECDVVVLFADIRGFTSLTERTNPRVLIERILNRYFTAMTEVLYHHDATIDKFLGDGIIGVFGTPIARPDDPQRSLLTAVHMQQAFAALSAEWQQELGIDIGMGIGLSYGPAVVGNIGSEQRLDYTLIGDVVNTANRLSGVARAGQIIISYHLYDALPSGEPLPWEVRPLGQVQLKGKQEPHLIYEVVVP